MIYIYTITIPIEADNREEAEELLLDELNDVSMNEAHLGIGLQCVEYEPTNTTEEERHA